MRTTVEDLLPNHDIVEAAQDNCRDLHTMVNRKFGLLEREHVEEDTDGVHCGLSAVISALCEFEIAHDTYQAIIDD